jgi:hypothetical protein
MQKLVAGKCIILKMQSNTRHMKHIGTRNRYLDIRSQEIEAEVVVGDKRANPTRRPDFSQML